MDSNLILLHLSLINGVGPTTFDLLINKKSKSFNLADIYTCTISDFEHLFGIKEEKAKKIVNGLKNIALLEKELSLIAKNNISWTTIFNDDYPELLKHIHYPPAVLYWHGSLQRNCEKNIAIVGSRKAHQYGKRAIDYFVSDLVKYGWTIVSGGAIGADSMAHKTTLEMHGKTIAVLGSGLLKSYPVANKRLFEKIIENNGAVLSSFPLTEKAYPGNFPARNRIIAGLSRGCIVIQAAVKSGARITANYALEQGREVFAVPGPIDDELSAGCNCLIQLGAKLVTCTEDILAEFGFVMPKVGQNGGNLKKGNLTFSDRVPSGPEGTILNNCAKACSVDELMAATKMGLQELNTLLFDLQMKGKITQNMAGMWETV